jgi:hypothetical protein
VRCAVAAALLLVAASPPGVRAEEQPAQPWVQLQHPEHPLWVELPPDTTVQRTSVFSLASPRLDDQKRAQFSLFGVRAVREDGNAYKALQVALVWITPEFAGADAESLRALPARIGDADAVLGFMRATLYAGMDAELEDRGRDLVGGRPVRRAGVRVGVARGTRDEREVSGEVALVPAAEDAALAVVARFDGEATTDERERVFPRILRSIRLGAGGDEAPLDARR